MLPGHWGASVRASPDTNLKDTVTDVADRGAVRGPAQSHALSFAYLGAPSITSFRVASVACPDVAQKPRVFTFARLLEQALVPRVFRRVAKRGSIVVHRNYFLRQVQTLLKFAKSTSDPQIVVVLVDKASELKFRADKTTPPSDVGPLLPDVERPTGLYGRGAGVEK